MERNDYAGVIHLHSSYSFDGRVPVSSMIRTARRCDVDFLLLTDHDTLQGRTEGWEGWHGNTLLIVGQEIAPRFNHYLAFATRACISSGGERAEIRPQACIDNVREQGGIGFIAHPDHGGAPLFHVKHYPWLDWEVHGYNGMGIWDFMTDWQAALRTYPRALFAYLFPCLVLRGPLPHTLARWDRLNRETPIVGIGELDNHNTIRRICGVPLPVFPFRRVLRTIRTHVLTDKPIGGDADQDASTLLAALARGSAYVALDCFREARGFTFSAEEDGREAGMGDSLSLRQEARLAVTLPYPARVRCFHDGQLISETQADSIAWRVSSPGAYRVEAHIRAFGAWRPWIYANPIYLRNGI